VKLFQRLPRGLLLTEAGRAALPELERGFAHLARAVGDLKGGSLAGPLAVSVIPSFAMRWLMPRLATFIAAWPEIELTVRSEMHSVDFAREEVDIGLRYGRGVYPGLEVRLLLTEEVFPVCAPSLLNGPKPLRRLSDLRHHVLLHDRQVPRTEPTLTWRAWLLELGAGLDEVDRGPGFTDSIMVMEAATRGLGIALGRSALVADDLAAGGLVRPLPVSRPADYAYYAVTPEGRGREPRISAFLAWLADEAAASRAQLGG
jgi:LysR family transcriptional regulator, glycine cleavage system transcriptional activator